MTTLSTISGSALSIARALGESDGVIHGPQAQPIGDNRDELIASKHRTREVVAGLAAEVR